MQGAILEKSKFPIPNSIWLIVMTEERWQSHGGMLGSENVPTVKHSLELLVEVRMIKDFGCKRGKLVFI